MICDACFHRWRHARTCRCRTEGAPAIRVSRCCAAANRTEGSSTRSVRLAFGAGLQHCVGIDLQVKSELVCEQHEARNLSTLRERPQRLERSTALPIENSLRCRVHAGGARSPRRRSVLRGFLVLGSDRPVVPTISAAPSKGDGLPVDRRLRPHKSRDAAFGAPVRKPKAQMDERGGLYLNNSSMPNPSCGVVGNRRACMKTAR